MFTETNASGATYSADHFTAQRNETSRGLYFYREASHRNDPALSRFASTDTVIPARVQDYELKDANQACWI